MSSSDWSLLAALRRAAAVFAVLALALASACTVKPLYSNPASDGAQAGVTADLSSIAIKPVEQRYAQQVRNHLIFLFNRGAGQPSAAAYTLTLVVTSSGEVAASGRRQITSSYDVPRQEFAAYRARLNAEDRAARELAELLNLAIAQQLSK